LSYRKANILLLLIVWFWVWGICPWELPSPGAEAGEATHAAHGHQEGDDTHHASKGMEHSCAGSGFYNSNQNLLKIGWLQLHLLSFDDLTLRGNLALQPNQTDGLMASLLQRTVLPKLLSDYYRLYSVYRI